jgi:hypothetical protein
VLLADHDVEIVADRGIDVHVGKHRDGTFGGISRRSGAAYRLLLIAAQQARNGADLLASQTGPRGSRVSLASSVLVGRQVEFRQSYRNGWNNQGIRVNCERLGASHLEELRTA